MLTEVLPGVFVMVGFAGWLLTGICAFLLATRHPQLPKRRPRWYLTNGWAFSSAANFAPSGAGLHRVLSIGMVTFVLSAVAALALGAVGSP